MATIGSVTYPTTTDPTEAGTSWQVVITGLTDDQAFTVSDGSDSVQVQVLIPNRLRFSTVITPFHASTGDNFVEAPLEVLP